MRLILTLLCFFLITHSYAQLYVGKEGLIVKPNSTLSVDGLALTPFNDLKISVNTLEKFETPVTINSKASIEAVYRFEHYVNFSGKALIICDQNKLNGNKIGKLQIVQTADESAGFAFALVSSVFSNQVYAEISNSRLRTVTAVGPEDDALPVKLVNFTAKTEDKTALISWTTARETNAAYFDIEQSQDAKSWESVKRVAATGESKDRIEYEHSYPDIFNGENYFRLKMVDNDGSFTYSQIKLLRFSTGDEIFVYPNPTTDRLFLKNTGTNKPLSLTIYDMLGKIKYQNSEVTETGIELADLLPGSYVVRIRMANGQLRSHHFIKL